MNRRDFLKVLSLTPFIPYVTNLSLAAPSQANWNNLLVLLELKGGNDGLNTVIPYTDPTYYDLRPRLGINRDKVLQLDEKMGFHPALEALMPLWKNNELAIIQSVGYPDPNLSHFRSIEIWETASHSYQYLSEGWLSRVFAAYPPPKTFAADAIVIGSSDLGPFSGGTARVVVLSNIQRFLTQVKQDGILNGRPANPALAHILKVEEDIRQAARNLKTSDVFKTEFPDSPFGNALKTASQVIAGNSGIAVIKVSLDGFDTHSNQFNRQERLLREMAEGLSAFKKALIEINRWNSTLILSYSEFGRRPRENLSTGTDHGTANVHFMLGGRVKGGLYGQIPRLNQLEGDNLRFAVDFRSLYATVIEKWWGFNASSVLGGKFEVLDILKA
jgi:uncharacterized protein (DUF1501 family)